MTTTTADGHGSDTDYHLPTLKQFLSDLYAIPRNSYIAHDNFRHLYIRKGPYRVDAKRENITIQIANIEVIIPGKNSFKKLCEDIKTRYPNIPIIAENVLEKWFQLKVLKMGFKEININEYSMEVKTFVLY